MGPMKLIDVVRKLEEMDVGSTIYCVKPWAQDALAIVEPEPSNGDIPHSAIEAEMAYFIEVFVARVFLSDWAANLGHMPSVREQCDRLIRYAIDDA